MKLSSQICAFAAIVLSLSYSNPLWANCQPQVDTQVMNQEALDKARLAVTSKDAIAILPFLDISTTQKDPLLAESIPYAFYDLLAAQADTVLHPYLTLQAWQKLQLSPELLAEQSTAIQVAKDLSVRFVIYGSVQRTDDEKMRFYISIYDAKIQENIYPVFQFATELNDFFFTNLKVGMEQFLKPLSLQKKDLKNLPKIPKLQAFRYYAKGMSYAQSYDENALAMAVVWFEKALKESYYDYPDAARERARSHYMLALLLRLTGRNPSQDLIEADRHAIHFAKIDMKAIKPKEQLTARFMNNLTHFTNALSYYKSSQAAKSVKEAEAGLKDVPEDGQLAYLLSLSGGKPSDYSKTSFVCFE